MAEKKTTLNYDPQPYEDFFIKERLADRTFINIYFSPEGHTAHHLDTLYTKRPLTDLVLAPHVDPSYYVTRIQEQFLVQLDPGMDWFDAHYPKSVYRSRKQMTSLITDARAYYSDKKKFPNPTSLRIIHVHQLSK